MYSCGRVDGMILDVGSFWNLPRLISNQGCHFEIQNQIGIETIKMQRDQSEGFYSLQTVTH
jgi:hypothetical protein